MSHNLAGTVTGFFTIRQKKIGGALPETSKVQFQTSENFTSSATWMPLLMRVSFVDFRLQLLLKTESRIPLVFFCKFPRVPKIQLNRFSGLQIQFWKEMIEAYQFF